MAGKNSPMRATRAMVSFAVPRMPSAIPIVAASATLRLDGAEASPALPGGTERVESRGGGDVGVIAAGCPVKRGLVAGAAGVGVGAGGQEQSNDLGAVGEIAGPIGDDMQRGASFERAAEGRGGELGRVDDDTSDGVHVAGS